MPNMPNFNFYEVDTSYVGFLKKFDSKVPNVEYTNHNKFFCGVVFKINDIHYFAPISSNKTLQKGNILIKEKTGRVLGSLRLNFMFPVPLDLISKKDFSKEDYKYQRLLNKELAFVRINQERILRETKSLYKQVIFETPIAKYCCNFKELERAYKIYCKEHNLESVTPEPNKSSKPSFADRIITAKEKATSATVPSKKDPLVK